MKQQRLWISLGFALACFALLFVLYVTPASRAVINGIDTFTMDFLYAFRGVVKPDSRLRVIGITENDIQLFREELGVPYPLPRDWHGELVRRLADSGARIIVMDILFAGEDSWDATEDEALRDAILYARSKHCEVVLASAIETMVVPGGSVRTKVTPAPVIMEAQPLLGLSNTTQKLGYRADETAWDSMQDGEEVLYSQAVQAFRIYCEQEGGEFEALLDNAVGQTRSFRINYSGPLEPDAQVSASLSSIFSNELFEHRDRNDLAEDERARLERRYTGSYVFIGSRAKADNDYFQTPYGTMYGVDTNASAFDTLVSGRYVRVLPPVQVLMACFALALLAWLTNQFKPVRNVWLAALVFAGLVVLVDLLLFSRSAIELSLTMTTLGYGLPLLTCFFHGAISDELAARRIRSLFGRYVASEVVEQIVRDPALADLGGVERTAAVMFNDIRNFSTLSEQLTAAQVVEFLNLYWGVVNDIVINNHGWINKFLGDGMVACFGGPVPTEKPVDDAVKTALEIVRRLHEELWPQLDARGLPRFQIGIGINVGRVIMGNIGSDIRQEYTVIGDAANVASRVESQTKEYGWSVLVTQSVVDGASGTYEFRFVGSQQVKGRQEEVRFYAVLDPAKEEVYRLTL
ncbi:adenylate/guanylate cyclase domain-containing protein [bacterium]|nr:adenylate/guanylate cyclase domain-containing protein [bacterium]